MLWQGQLQKEQSETETLTFRFPSSASHSWLRTAGLRDMYSVKSFPAFLESVSVTNPPAPYTEWHQLCSQTPLTVHHSICCQESQGQCGHLLGLQETCFSIDGRELWAGDIKASTLQTTCVIWVLVPSLFLLQEGFLQQQQKITS